MRNILFILLTLFGLNAFSLNFAQAEECDYDHLVGVEYTPALFADAGSTPVRVMKPDTDITMGEHVPGRINVLLEEDSDTIVAVACE